MNSLENPLSTDKSSETDNKDVDKDKKKSRRVASRLIDSEIQTPKSKDKMSSSWDEFFEYQKTKDKLKDDHEVSEAKAPLENLSDEETQVIASIFREEARADRGSEPEETEAEQFVHEVLDIYDSKIIEDNIEPDEAYEQVMEELGVDPAEIEDIVLVQEPELDPELINQLEISNLAQEIDLASDTGEIPLEHKVEAKDVDIDEPAALADTADSRPHVTPPATFSGNGGFSGGSIERSGLSSSDFESGAVAAASSPGISPEQNRAERDKDLLTGLLVGGVIGYLIGRRRGRIKTERKLLPVQKKLEKQVVSLNNKLEKQEYTIRKIAVQKAELESQKPVRAVKPKPEARQKVRLETVGRSEKLKEEIKKVESKKTSKNAELHIGELLVLNREEKAKPTKNQVETKASVTKKEAPIRVETLNHQELLKVSEKVIVDGTNLRQIYETQLVGEKGLRRLVTEYLGGGDIKKALKREIVEREIDFERDPNLRDMAPSHNTTIVSGSSDAALAQMIKKAEASVASSQEEVAFLRAKSDYDSKQQDQKAKQVKLINGALTGTVLVLIVFVILLYLTRHT